jgi:acetyl-CoA carboxylase biotin carboxyl carrier protein
VIDLAFIESLIRAIDQSGLDSIEIERGGTRVRLSKTPPPAPGAPPQGYSVSAVMPHGIAMPAPGPAAPSAGWPAQGAEPAEPRAAAEGRKLLEIKSPMVGTFYAKPAPDKPDYVSVGSRVKPDTVVCKLEAMKIFNDLTADVAGVIAEVCVKNGQPVDFGTVLFRVEPA